MSHMLTGPDGLDSRWLVMSVARTADAPDLTEDRHSNIKLQPLLPRFEWNIIDLTNFGKEE
jgi:hypothetical protein